MKVKLNVESTRSAILKWTQPAAPSIYDSRLCARYKFSSYYY